MMVSYRVLRVVLVFLFLHLRTQHCTYATEIIRDVKGDLFSITHCGPPSRCKANGTPCTLPLTCQDKEAVCEGSLCCMCRCPAHSLRPTYVDDKSRNVSGCVDNSKLPMKLSMDENACRWRLVAQEKDKNSCFEETVPVIGLNSAGRHLLELCTFNRDTALGLENITSCSVTRGGARYFDSGKWNSSGAMFTIGNTTDNLFVQWNRYTGVDASGYILNINVRCSLKDGRHVTACLILKSTNETNAISSPKTTPRLTTSSSTTTSILTTTAKITTAKDRIPQQPKTTSPTSVFRTDRETTDINNNKLTEEKSTNISLLVTPSRSLKLSTGASGSVGIVFVPTTLLETTSSSSAIPATEKEKTKDSIYLMVAIGCSMFVFCAVFICILVMVRRRKRKLQNKHMQGNPLYDDGATIPIVAINASNGTANESEVFYQPLVQNSRCKHNNKPVVYQTLMKKGRSLDALNDYKNAPNVTNGVQYQSLDRKKCSRAQGAANKVYQSLTPPRDINTGQMMANEEPSDVVYYSTPDDVYKDSILPVNKKRLKGYYEPGCIVLAQQTDNHPSSTDGTSCPTSLKTEPPQYELPEQDPHRNLTSQQTLEPAAYHTKDLPEYQVLECHPLYHVVERA